MYEHRGPIQVTMVCPRQQTPSQRAYGYVRLCLYLWPSKQYQHTMEACITPWGLPCFKLQPKARCLCQEGSNIMKDRTCGHGRQIQSLWKISLQIQNALLRGCSSTIEASELWTDGQNLMRICSIDWNILGPIVLICKSEKKESLQYFILEQTVNGPWQPRSTCEHSWLSGDWITIHPTLITVIPFWWESSKTYQLPTCDVLASWWFSQIPFLIETYSPVAVHHCYKLTYHTEYSTNNLSNAFPKHCLFFPLQAKQDK